MFNFRQHPPPGNFSIRNFQSNQNEKRQLLGPRSEQKCASLYILFSPSVTIFRQKALEVCRVFDFCVPYIQIFQNRCRDYS